MHWGQTKIILIFKMFSKKMVQKIDHSHIRSCFIFVFIHHSNTSPFLLLLFHMSFDSNWNHTLSYYLFLHSSCLLKETVETLSGTTGKKSHLPLKCTVRQLWWYTYYEEGIYNCCNIIVFIATFTTLAGRFEPAICESKDQYATHNAIQLYSAYHMKNDIVK
jgi:hypothetical protein